MIMVLVMMMTMMMMHDDDKVAVVMMHDARFVMCQTIREQSVIHTRSNSLPPCPPPSLTLSLSLSLKHTPAGCCGTGSSDYRR